jgi:hypothetical protein
MRKLIDNKRGSSLPVVIGIVSFLIASSFILITYVLYQTRAIEADFKYQQEYANSQQRIDASVHSIIQNNDISIWFINDLSLFMNVEITEYGSNTLMIADELTNGTIVKSYVAKLTEDISLVDEYLNYTGLETDFQLNPLISPTNMLTNYLRLFFDENFPDVTLDEPFNDIKDVVAFIENLTATTSNTFIEVSPSVLENQTNPTVGEHWYVNGSVTLDKNKDLTIPDGYILVIDGDLKLRDEAALFGNVIVNGNVTFDSNKDYATIQGTIYALGNVMSEDLLYLGTSSRPAFIFSEKKIQLEKIVDGYGYLIADRIEFDRKATSVHIIGGAYADAYSNLNVDEIDVNTTLNVEDLYTFGISPLISSGTGESEGYIFTYPK